MRIFLVILAALIVAGGTGFYVLQGLRPAAPRGRRRLRLRSSRQVFVPAHELPIGTIITPDRLSRMEITEGALNGEMIVADAAGKTFLAGSVARQVLPQGVPIARSSIVRPGDRGFLAAVLPKGMRAITIPVDEIAGLSGLALPGDRVDLILTYSVSGDSEAAASAPARRSSPTCACWPSTSGSGPRPARGQGRQGRRRAGRQDRDARGLAAPGGDDHPRPDARHPVADPELGPRRRRRRQDKLAKTDAVEPRRDGASLLKAAEAHACARRADARVRRDLDQQGADRARRRDPRHGDRRRCAPRPPPPPPPNKPPPDGNRAVKRHRPLAVALAAAFVIAPGRLAGPARRLRAGRSPQAREPVEPRGRHRPADPGRRGVLEPLRRQPGGGRRGGEIAAADVPDRRGRRRDHALRGGRQRQRADVEPHPRHPQHRRARGRHPQHGAGAVGQGEHGRPVAGADRHGRQRRAGGQRACRWRTSSSTTRRGW